MARTKQWLAGVCWLGLWRSLLPASPWLSGAAWAAAHKASNGCISKECGAAEAVQLQPSQPAHPEICLPLFLLSRFLSPSFLSVPSFVLVSLPFSYLLPITTLSPFSPSLPLILSQLHFSLLPLPLSVSLSPPPFLALPSLAFPETSDSSLLTGTAPLAACRLGRGKGGEASPGQCGASLWCLVQRCECGSFQTLVLLGLGSRL